MQKIIIIVSVLFVSFLVFSFLSRNNHMKIKINSNLNSNIVFLGDSLSAGYGADIENSVPAFFSKKVNINVINAGISGDTTSGGLERLKKDVLTHNPVIVIVELGANDYFKSENISNTKKNLKTIIEEIRKTDAVVFIPKFYPKTYALGILKPGDKKQYDEMFIEFQNMDKVFVIENMWKNVWGKRELMHDNIHPNAKGYEIMAENYFNEMKPFLKYNKLLKND